MAGWRDQANERLKEKKQGSTIALEEGDNCLRVCPDKKDILPDGKLNPKGVQNLCYREFRVHRDVGPENSKRTVACGCDILGKGKCWLCQVKIPELEANPNKRKLAQTIQAKEQFMVNASRFDPDAQKFTTIKPWWISTGSGIPGRQSVSLAVRVFQKIVSEKKDYVDPNKGYNLNIERSGQGLKTRYVSVEGDDTKSVVPAALLAAMKSLDSFVPKYDEQEQKDAYFGRKREDRQEREAAVDESEYEPVPDEVEPDPNEDVVDDEVVDEAADPDTEELAAEVEPEPEEGPDPYADEPAEVDPDDAETGEELELEPEPEPEPPPRRTAPPAKPAAKAPSAPAKRPAAVPPSKPPVRPAALPAKKPVRR